MADLLGPGVTRLFTVEERRPGMPKPALSPGGPFMTGSDGTGLHLAMLPRAQARRRARGEAAARRHGRAHGAWRGLRPAWLTGRVQSLSLPR